MKYEAGEGEEWRSFYNQHRGGAGNIIMVSAFGATRSDMRVAMFSCIERAEEWAATLGDDVQVVFSPHVVDEPDYGNAVKQ